MREPREDALHITAAEAEKRIDPAICTSDRAWRSRHREFSQRLNRPNKTLADIPPETFTFYEARLLVASSRPEPRQLQSDRTRRYRALLRERFKGVAEDQATKLTMAYFGLPVEPLGASEEAEDEMNVDMEIKGEQQQGKQTHSDTHAVPPPDQPALRLRGGGSASDTEEDVSDEDETHGDDTSDSGDEQSSNGFEWAPLHGFQGVVPFIPGDVNTFETAVSRLLSLPPGSTATYVLVHFHAQEGTLVEIEDELGSGADGPAVDYIVQHWYPDDDDDEAVLEHPDDCCALFVRLKGETTPTMWKPTEGQLKADVAQIKYKCTDVNMSLSRGPASAAYVSFPKTTGPDGPHVGLWDAGEYLPYMQTAVDVLLGRHADDHRHHAVLQLAKASDERRASFSRFYGVVPVRPHDIQAMHPQQQPEAVLLRVYPLSELQVAFVLPGFHPEPTSGVVSVVHAADLRPYTPGRLPNAIQHLRYMVTQFLGDEAVGVPYVRLLSGDATLRPGHVDRRQVTTLIPMSDAVMREAPTPPVEVCRALERFLDTRPRVIVLYPQYKQGEATMHARWPTDAPPEKRRHPLPPLSSTADEFRAHVAELSRAVWSRAGGGGVLYEPRVHRVSIRAMVSSTGAQAEAATWFVGPQTTDEEWFAIRAQLTTRNAEVNIWRPAKWQWKRQIARSNVWGPRYGRAADGNARAMQGHAAVHETLAAMLSTLPVRKPALMAPDAAPEHHKHHHEDPAPRPSMSKEADGNKPGAPVTACPHAGCGFTFRGDERAAFERHVSERHVARQCPWCEEPLPAWWPDEAKDAHLRSRHRDRLMQALGVRRATINQRDGSATVSIALRRGPAPAPSPWATGRYSAPPVDVGRSGAQDDETWQASANPLPLYGAVQAFCDRCGRDRRQFFSEAEQAYHDRHCAPGIYHGAQCTFCTECGDYRWGSDLDAARSGRCAGGAVPCGHATGSEAGRFCHRCGLDFDALLRGGREVHEACCRGYGAQPGRFCPHCGVRFWEGHAQADWYHNMRHIETCEARHVAVEQPDITTQEARRDSQPRRVLSAPPGRIPGPKQPASKKKQKPKPRHRQHPDDDEPLPSVEDEARRRARKRRRPHPDDSDYEYRSDVDSADGLAPEASDNSDGGDPDDPAAARRRKRRRMLELDPAYQYETDEDSADGLQPDVDDLGGDDEQVDAEAEAEAQAQGLAQDEELERAKAEAMATATAKGQRKPHDPTYRYACDADSADGLKPDVDDLNAKQRGRPEEASSEEPADAAPPPAPDAVPAPPPAAKGKQGRKPAKKASPKKATQPKPKPKPKPAPKKAATASPPKPRQPKKKPESAPPPRRSARIGSKKP
ncbi:Uncharacterized protein TPAR_01539 [Tolypocladium paradoxum]|uniref:Uncharacterized protein n=1 Tax=Tolypocladium paradoxum TaxID=94208 RepID=A0A2S4L772_9HYPO|nr:Uncharacterized protein TPAR_01539 [Tolypocladium paradoxum]